MKFSIASKLFWCTAALYWLLIGGCATTGGVVPSSKPYTLSEGSFVSFWKQQVQYPIPVSYYTVTDSSNKNWEIAVADSHVDSRQKAIAPALVLIHGRGANMGYFSQLMGYAIDAGVRVIAVDLPGYGKSIPGNLENPIPRTLSDSRALVHDVLVNQMGLKNATYLGHSMGGQWVIGYALQYPAAVNRIILESSYGLEEYDAYFQKDKATVLPLFDPSYRYDYEKWKTIWKPLGQLENEFSQRESSIKNFYNFRKIDPKTGQEQVSDTGYFWQESIDSAFLTSVRIDMINSNPKEYDHYVRTTVWDIYGQGIEVVRSNQNSLVKKLNQLTVPVFLAFGRHDPFLPSTAFSGNDDLIAQLVRPAVTKLMATQNKPAVVIYENAGHIPHADMAADFSSDVIQYVKYGSVLSKSEDVFDGIDLAAAKSSQTSGIEDDVGRQNITSRKVGNLSYISSSEKIYLQSIEEKVNRTLASQFQSKDDISKLYGKLRISLTVGEYGMLERIEILEASDIPELNKLALKAFTASAPFHNLPTEWAPNIKQFEVQRYWEFLNGEFKMTSPI